MKVDSFNHKMAAHCESGTLTQLINFAGLKITEPMVFGLGGGFYFGYFHKNPGFNFPFFFVRTKPGELRKDLEKRVGIKFYKKKFKSEDEAEKELDRLLEQNIPVAVQVDFYYMDYIPSWERVHANIHHIIIIGKEGDEYLISDSYYPQVARLHKDKLRMARFTGGYMAPKGFLYYPVAVPESIDYDKTVKKALKKVIKNMLGQPVPFIGIKGIRRFAKKILLWPELARSEDHLSHEVMKINVFLEDQGTGGAGFRYMFATFLREVSEILKNDAYLEFSKRIMEIGDEWRSFSVFAAKMGKNRELGSDNFKVLSEKIYALADLEEKYFKDLKQAIK